MLFIEAAVQIFKMFLTTRVHAVFVLKRLRTLILSYSHTFYLFLVQRAHFTYRQSFLFSKYHTQNLSRSLFFYFYLLLIGTTDDPRWVLLVDLLDL